MIGKRWWPRCAMLEAREQVAGGQQGYRKFLKTAASSYTVDEDS